MSATQAPLSALGTATGLHVVYVSAWLRDGHFFVAHSGTHILAEGQTRCSGRTPLLSTYDARRFARTVDAAADAFTDRGLSRPEWQSLDANALSLGENVDPETSQALLERLASLGYGDLEFRVCSNAYAAQQACCA